MLLVDKSEVYITGSTEFIGNQAGDDGGKVQIVQYLVLH